MKSDRNRRDAVRIIGSAIAAAALLAGLSQAHAQAWPEKSVKIIVPNSTGSRPDIITRMLAERLSRAFGRQFVVDNSVAGGGLVGAQAAARSAPDGYTFFMGAVDTLATHSFYYESLPYDPVHDFTPVAMVTDSMAYAIGVNIDVPAKTLSELIALAKRQPGKLSCAADTGSASVIAGWFAKVTGTQITPIPYKSVATSTQDVMAGRVEMIIIGLSSIAPALKSGKVRLIAITSQKRFPGLEEIPTAAETIPGFSAYAWLTLVAPAATPANIVQRLNRETDQVLKEPEVVERLRSFGATTSGAGTAQSISEFIRAERERWGKIMKEVGIKPQQG